jgi:tRNA(Arg) A34 adenosine deaminase TadA
MKVRIESSDREFLKRAVVVASEGIEKGGGPFGAVIVRGGEIIAEAYNKVVYNSDPTAHAEILAIRNACELLGTHDLSGCDIYASCEPCPMCLGAVYWSGISRVFYASARVDAAEAGFSDELYYDEMSKSPDERKIVFCRIDDIDANEVFKLWDRYEKKIRY